MGFLSGLFGRKRREQEFLLEFVKAAQEGQSKASIRSAVSTMGGTLNHSDDVQFVGYAASAWAKEVATESTGTEKEQLAAGLFAMVAANHFSYKVGASFELASSLAILDTLGLAGSDRAPDVIDLYNKTVISRPDIIKAIATTLINWEGNPSSDKLDRCRQLYQICRDGVTD